MYFHFCIQVQGVHTLCVLWNVKKALLDITYKWRLFFPRECGRHKCKYFIQQCIVYLRRIRRYIHILTSISFHHIKCVFSFPWSFCCIKRSYLSLCIFSNLSYFDRLYFVKAQRDPSPLCVC